ncbi:MAG: hypothetical protein FWE53_03485 [Firmicutes bacterium]|nr:hypothetical protein [Bacillota bacterium]
MTVLKCAMCGASISPEPGATLARCEFCGSSTAFEKSPSGGVGAVRTVFARWAPDGFYYPATIIEEFANHVKVLFLDGVDSMILKEHVVELQQAYKTMRFEGNWQNQGFFYTGKIASHEPLIFNYDDGDVEELMLVQLRGTKL